MDLTENLYSQFSSCLDILKDKFNFACLNFAAGYYNYHTSNEYVIVEDVKNSIKLGENVIGKLGNSFYEFKSTEKESDFWFD